MRATVKSEDHTPQNRVQIRRVRGRSHIVFRPSPHVAVTILAADAYQLANDLVDAAERVER